MQKILDVTDRRTRFRQHLSMIVCGLLAGSGTAMFILNAGSTVIGWIAIGSAVALLAVTASVKQRWETEYKGHHIRFENSPVLAESLYLDGGLVTRGGVGQKMELRAPIRVGQDAGSEIVALVDAKAWSFRLRLFVQSPEPHPDDHADATAPPSVSDSTQSATATRTIDTAADENSSQPATGSTFIGKFQVAKQVIELLSAVIGLIGGLSTLIGWLS